MQGEVTFFHTDSIEKLTVREVARIAEARGFRTRFSERLREPAEIGVYCSHNADPSRSEFSVVILHDLGQRHDVWPHFWSQEPWTRYGVGFVRGATWVDQFLSAKPINRFLAPKHGRYAAGWPKAEPIFDATGSFQAELARMRAALALEQSKQTVLYAPSSRRIRKRRARDRLQRSDQAGRLAAEHACPHHKISPTSKRSIATTRA